MTQSNLASPSTDANSAIRSTAAPRPGPSINQQKMLSITAATVLLGGAVGLVLAGDKDSTGSTGASLTDDTPASARLPEDIDVAGKVTDGMSFGQAFGAAREEVGMGGVFSWHGRWYNTFEKEEWIGLSLEQRQEYAELITGEKLPVRSYYSPPSATAQSDTKRNTAVEELETKPTIIEGYLNGQRVMGLDYDQDGVIDTLVMDGPDGQTYRVVDATGNEGLDTVYRYDSLDGQLTGAIILDHPVVLSNDDFSQGLEARMAKEVVDSILQPDASAATPALPIEMDDVDESEPDETSYLTYSSEPDDTYINDGNVRDMDE